jgi:hypothetical protein
MFEAQLGLGTSEIAADCECAFAAHDRPQQNTVVAECPRLLQSTAPLQAWQDHLWSLSSSRCAFLARAQVVQLRGLHLSSMVRTMQPGGNAVSLRGESAKTQRPAAVGYRSTSVRSSTLSAIVCRERVLESRPVCTRQDTGTLLYTCPRVHASEVVKRHVVDRGTHLLSTWL